MDEKTLQEEQQLNDNNEAVASENDNQAGQADAAAGEADIADGEAGAPEVEVLRRQIDELKDKYLRQVADFDNFRKRTARERIELSQTAGKDIIASLLPILDDSERAEKQFDNAQDVSALKEGLRLVFGKLRNVLQSKGLKPMQSVGEDFSPEFHEAITEIPAPNRELKGKVVDEVEKGYYLNDKIIRFAKVVVGK